jgi:hypothetical protein
MSSPDLDTELAAYIEWLTPLVLARMGLSSRELLDLSKRHYGTLATLPCDAAPKTLEAVLALNQKLFDRKDKKDAAKHA